MLFAISFFIVPISIAQDRPRWINEPSVVCSPGELCALGEGLGLLGAQMRARAAIAESFEVKISSKATFTQEVSGDGELSEDIATRLEQTTDLLLNSVVIKTHYIDRESVYALAALDRRHGALFLRQQIEKIDSENQELLKKAGRSSLARVMKNLKVRGKLEQYHHFLVQKNIPSPISYDEIYKKKNLYAQNPVTVFVEFTPSAHLAPLQHEFVRMLLAQDYKVVTSSEQKYKYRTKIHLEVTPLHLRVKGFERYGYQLVITSFLGNQEQSLGQVVFNNEQIARNQEQGLERAIAQFNKQLEEQIEFLNLD